MTNYEALEEDDQEVIARLQRIRRYKIVVTIITVILGFALGISLLLLIIGASTCSIDSLGNQWEGFGPDGQLLYLVNFNTGIMQANYVSYISTAGGNGGTRKTFLNDPYGLDTLTTNDYTNTGYDRGHLVPNADYGDVTYYMPNVVPMTPNFNRGIWNQVEQEIRANYAGKLVYKGCRYTEDFTYSQLGKRLYIPQGCHYVVFDSSDLDFPTPGHILDHGYYEMTEGSQKQPILPSWIRC